MRSTPIRLIAIVFLLSLPSAFASADEAKKVFDSLFAPKIKAVSATIDRADDIALGKEMLAIAKTSEGQAELLALLCDQVHDLCIKHADGFAVAVESQQLLADKVETKRAGAQEKLTTLLTRQMTTGKADEREGAGESLIELLLSMGDEKFEKKQYAEAAGDYRRAVTVATQRKSASLEEAKAKLEFAAARDRAVKNLARLQEKLLKDANDFPTAEEIVKLYVIALDDPAGAVPFLNRVKDEQLKKNVQLAVKDEKDLDDTECLLLGEWYKSNLDGSHDKVIGLRRARTYLTRFLSLHSDQDLARAKGDAMLKEVNSALASIATVRTGGSSTEKPSAELVVSLSVDHRAELWLTPKGFVLVNQEGARSPTISINGKVLPIEWESTNARDANRSKLISMKTSLKLSELHVEKITEPGTNRGEMSTRVEKDAFVVLIADGEGGAGIFKFRLRMRAR